MLGMEDVGEKYEEHEQELRKMLIDEERWVIEEGEIDPSIWSKIVDKKRAT